MERPERILFFDGVCNLCNGLVQFIIKHDHRAIIKFSPLQSETGARVLNNPSVEGEDSVIYLTEGNYYLRSTAILRMFRDMGGGWKLLYGFIVVPRFMRDFVYNLIARNRYRIFGRREYCMVPSSDIKERFIEITPSSST